MNRPLRIPLLLLPALLLACGGEAQAPETEVPADPAPVTETAEPGAPADAPAGEGFTPPALTPASISPDTPISVTALRDAILAPYGRTVTVHGYVHDPFRDPETIRGSVALAAAPSQTGGETQLVGCDLD